MTNVLRCSYAVTGCSYEPRQLRRRSDAEDGPTLARGARYANRPARSRGEGQMQGSRRIAILPRLRDHGLGLLMLCRDGLPRPMRIAQSANSECHEGRRDCLPSTGALPSGSARRPLVQALKMALSIHPIRLVKIAIEMLVRRQHHELVPSLQSTIGSNNTEDEVAKRLRHGGSRQHGDRVTHLAALGDADRSGIASRLYFAQVEQMILLDPEPK